MGDEMTNWPADKIERRKVADLIPYARNARTHSDEQVAQIAASINEWGWTTPVLIDDKGGIIAGHGRVMAARKLGIDEVPTMTATGWTKAQKAAYVLADNQLPQNAGWDMDLLSVEMKDLDAEGFDLSLMGFNDDMLANMLKEETEGLTDEDAVPDVPDDPVTVLGDVWLLGNHRVMCGDSTSIDAVEKLMGGVKADMVFTDPPYNVAFNGRSGKHDVIKNDNLSDADFAAFIDGTINTIQAIDPKVYYIWCNWKFYGALQGRLDYKACIVWAKNVFGMGSGYRHQHEFCLFNGKIDEQVKNESDLWECKKDSKYVHPTQKPVELSVRAFGNHVRLLNVLDLFGGSGSTLIGAEQTGRNAFLMELDPKYCDVIIQRWCDFTGKDAKLERTGETFSVLKKGSGKNAA
jgi:DNA modification methylase